MSDDSKTRKSTWWIWVFLVVLLLSPAIAAQLIFSPQLVTYSSNGQGITAIYWKNLEGNRVLTGTQATFVRLDETTDNLHICFEVKEDDVCQVYRVTQRQGSAAALIHWVNQNLK